MSVRVSIVFLVSSCGGYKIVYSFFFFLIRCRLDFLFSRISPLSKPGHLLLCIEFITQYCLSPLSISFKNEIKSELKFITRKMS